jgi:hypothetical protein
MSDFYVFVLIVISFITVVALCISFCFGTPKPRKSTPNPGDLEATRVDKFRSYAYLTTCGREVFFPPAHEGAVCEITIDGILHNDEGEFSDLFHRTDSSGNFSHGANWLVVNGSSLTNNTWESVVSDRFNHKYIFRVDHSRERLTLALHRNTRWQGYLTANVTVLPMGTPRIAETREAHSARVKAKVEEEAVGTKFAAQIQALCVRSQAFRNWANPDYQKKFAEAHTDELIRNQAEIREEAITFLAQDQIVRYLRRHHKEVVDRFLGRLEALLLAENLQLDKRLAGIAPPAAPPPKRKLTAEQVRSLKVHRQQVAIGDKVALKLDKIETRLNIRERLEQMPLDQDERELLEEELISEIEDGDGESENGKTI